MISTKIRGILLSKRGTIATHNINIHLKDVNVTIVNSKKELKYF